jgi:hypothetical protein
MPDDEPKPPKKMSSYDLAHELDRLVLVLPMVEAQREIIKEAARRLVFLEK